MIIGTLLIVFSTVTGWAQGPGCGATRSATVSDSGVGALRLGLTADQVRARCTVVRDTTLPNWDFAETERVLFVTVGPDTLQAALSPEERVVRIYVDTPRVRTAHNLGVGTALRTLVRPGAVGAASEATFAIEIREHCGLRFVMNGVHGVEQGSEVDYQHRS